MDVTPIPRQDDDQQRQFMDGLWTASEIIDWMAKRARFVCGKSDSEVGSLWKGSVKKDEVRGRKEKRWKEKRKEEGRGRGSRGGRGESDGKEEA